MANTFTLIEAKTLLTTNASVTFSSIPQTYQDLKLLISVRTDAANVTRGYKIQPNNTDITAIRLGTEGNPQTPYTDATISPYIPGSSATSSTFSNSEVYISNYASTTAYKSLSIDSISENNGEDAGLALLAGLYSSNTAITAITIVPTSGSFIANSTFYLYGINKS